MTDFWNPITSLGIFHKKWIVNKCIDEFLGEELGAVLDEGGHPYRMRKIFSATPDGE